MASGDLRPKRTHGCEQEAPRQASSFEAATATSPVLRARDEESLKAIAEVDPGARVNIAIFSEGRVGATVDGHGEP